MPLFFEPMQPQQLQQLPVLTLAHIGDGIYELLARNEVVRRGAHKVAQMHRDTVALVNAPAQARAARHILPDLSEGERAIFLRGRNSRVNTVPKGASPGQYAQATGLEALFGLLYLSGEHARIQELWRAIITQADETE